METVSTHTVSTTVEVGGASFVSFTAGPNGISATRSDANTSSAALLVALLLSRLVFKHPFGSIWWQLLREDRGGLPSYTQASTHGLRLLERLETIVSPARRCVAVIIDSIPLPVCRPERGKRCAFPGARWGFGTQGDVSGYTLHAWVTPEGEIVQSRLRPAKLHDTTVSDELNRRWPEFGGPKIIGDQGSCCLEDVFPPKKTSRYDTGWRFSRHPK